MKVFNVSPHRSGTQSFHQFVSAHGFRSAHWPGPELDNAAQWALGRLDQNLLYRMCHQYYASADVFSDFPTALVYQEIAKDYPDALFVLIQRDAAGWVRSVRRHTAGRDLSYLEAFFYRPLLPECPVFGLDGYSDERLEAAYRTHCSRVKNFMRTHGYRFLVGELGNEHLAEMLGEFMGFEVEHPLEVIH